MATYTSPLTPATVSWGQPLAQCWVPFACSVPLPPNTARSVPIGTRSESVSERVVTDPKGRGQTASLRGSELGIKIVSDNLSLSEATEKYDNRTDPDPHAQRRRRRGQRLPRPACLCRLSTAQEPKQPAGT